MESGRQSITLAYLIRIARVLGVELGDLVGDAGRH
jgi:hypothetical protein